MRFTDVFVKRPVFATTLSLLLLLFGAVSYFKLPVRWFPKLDQAVVSVQIQYYGANASLMEGFVTTPVEDAIMGVDNVDYIQSASNQGVSSITVHMKLGTDINTALSNISNKVNSIRYKLPQQIQDPVIGMSSADSTGTMFLTFTSRTMTIPEVNDYLNRVVKPQLQSLNGVGEAQIMGGQEYAMRVWLNPKEMAARKVTSTDVAQAIGAQNIQAAPGHLQSEMLNYTIKANTDLHTAKQFNSMVIRNEHGRVVRISDVGQAQLGAKGYDASLFDSNGEKISFIQIVPKSNANPLTISKEIHKALPSIQTHMPKNLHMKVFYDAANNIHASLNEVGHTIIEASIFVFIVIFLMLGSFRSVLIPIVTIPLSLIGVCTLMLMFGFSINVLTLLAFVLAIGLVVDDAIVVLENIYRHIKEGMTPFKAALKGAAEIAFAVIAMSLTLAAVYLPIGFMGGLTGKLFSEFAFTLAGTVLISGFIALTLTPMMCSKVYGMGSNKVSRLEGWVNKLFEHLKISYKHALNFLFKFWYVVAIIAVVTYGSCYVMFTHTHQELAPTEDDGFLIGMVVGPASANLKYIEQHTNILGAIYKKIPQIESFVSINGWPSESGAINFMVLKPKDKRKLSNVQIRNELFPQMWSVPGVMAFPIIMPSIPVSGMQPVDFILKTTKGYDYLYKVATKMQGALQGWGGITNLQVDLKIDKPQLSIDINRSSAADLGIPMSSIANALNVYLGAPITSRFAMNGRSYEVIPQLYQQFRNRPESLRELYLRTQSQKLVPLSNLVRLTDAVIPRSLGHFQGLRSAEFTGNLAPGVTIGDAVDHFVTLAHGMLPKDVDTDYAGQTRQFVQSKGKMLWTFIFAILFIYLVLAAQFESFRDPLIVMLSVPLATAGALIALHIDGATLNIYTKIGLVTLIGLITKAGILIVEFANQKQEEGMSRRDAVVEAAITRLRPILMTTFAMILGALPLLLASGAGSVSRHQMGVVIIGGMSFGTVLTLFVVPVAYYLLAAKVKAKAE